MLDSLSQFLINLKQDNVVTVGFNFACAFCPCFLTLFFFDNALFQTLDTVKLVLLCFSIGLPFLFLSFYLTMGVSTELKHLVTSFLEMKSLDKYKITYKEIDKINKHLSTRFVGGFIGSATWMLTGLITAFASLFFQFEKITTYGYWISLTYIVMLQIISWIATFVFKTIADGLDKKNDQDYAE